LGRIVQTGPSSGSHPRKRRPVGIRLTIRRVRKAQGLPRFRGPPLSFLQLESGIDGKQGRSSSHPISLPLLWKSRLTSDSAQVSTKQDDSLLARPVPIVREQIAAAPGECRPLPKRFWSEHLTVVAGKPFLKASGHRGRRSSAHSACKDRVGLEPKRAASFRFCNVVEARRPRPPCRLLLLEPEVISP